MNAMTPVTALPPNDCRITLGVLSDLHLGPCGAPATMFNQPVEIGKARERTTEALNALPEVDALAILGDLSDTANSADYEFLLESLANRARLTYLIAGNHDVPHDKTAANALNRAIAERQLSDVAIPPVGGIPFSWIRVASAPIYRTRDGFENDIRTDGLPLPTGRPEPLLWLSHFPVLSVRHYLESAGLRYAGDLDNCREVEKSLRSYGAPVIVLNGHLHARTHAVSGNILQLSWAALSEFPNEIGQLVIAITDQNFSVTQHCVSLNDRRLSASQTFVWRESVWQARTK